MREVTKERKGYCEKMCEGCYTRFYSTQADIVGFILRFHVVQEDGISKIYEQFVDNEAHCIGQLLSVPNGKMPPFDPNSSTVKVNDGLSTALYCSVDLMVQHGTLSSLSQIIQSCTGSCHPKKLHLICHSTSRLEVKKQTANTGENESSNRTTVAVHAHASISCLIHPVRRLLVIGIMVSVEEPLGPTSMSYHILEHNGICASCSLLNKHFLCC